VLFSLPILTGIEQLNAVYRKISSLKISNNMNEFIVKFVKDKKVLKL
jgi:hypothetical protein